MKAVTVSKYGDATQVEDLPKFPQSSLQLSGYAVRTFAHGWFFTHIHMGVSENYGELTLGSL